ncbi:hypothetical protein Gocc_2924 [Gaiella occulta]|uniref:Uncharacterized protein n=1 Tax=Gaiella occulta TaxID=1002870 RepID=A0A7M2YTV3_9ACTN|nr:hypothetical protein [Gaiella occulta]RDI73324.1 hypothetical protein Gocc_2924 [Gaiella occulta]
MARELEHAELAAADHLVGEALDVWRLRYRAARDAGLDPFDAELFASSSADTGLLRRLHANGCDPQLIAEIVL